MISVNEALSIIRRETHSLGHERINLEGAVGRVLADDIIADMDLPPFDRSQMDGFAFRSDAVRNAPAELRVVGESAAGLGWHRELRPGEAVRIMTGAPVPPGADTVQKVELTSEANFDHDANHPANDTVTILESIAAQKNIVRRGSEIKKGERVLTKGGRVTERNVSVLAAFGYSIVAVSKRPKVSILTTGSEVVEIDQKPGPDQIRNSNSTMLSAMLGPANCGVDVLKSTTDDLEAIKDTIAGAALESDIIVTTGGVSVGKYDLTKKALAELGAEIFFDKVRLKPGKPTVFARLGETLIFGLPGNPVSAAVTYYLFVRHALMLMQNAAETELRRARSVAASTFKAARDRDTYLPAQTAVGEDGRLSVSPLKWLGSSDFIGFAASDALAYVPAGEKITEGELIDILLLY